MTLGMMEWNICFIFSLSILPSGQSSMNPCNEKPKDLFIFSLTSDYSYIFGQQYILDTLISCATADENQVDLVPLFDVILCEAGVVGYEFELAWAELHFGSRLALRFAEPAHCCIVTKD